MGCVIGQIHIRFANKANHCEEKSCNRQGADKRETGLVIRRVKPSTVGLNPHDFAALQTDCEQTEFI